MTGGGQEATGTPKEPGEAPAGVRDAMPDGPLSAVDATRFAHGSEAEMARILDFYDVRWQYEPATFPILWNLDGEVVESFAPDFYLPDLDLFLEMTTLKQRLVRKKNRKLRRLRELYPDIRIKLFYARDFRAMMLKYGRFGLAESLSGTPGQVVPERVAVELERVRPEAPEPSPVPDGEPSPHPAAEPAVPAPVATKPPTELLAAGPGSADRPAPPNPIDRPMAPGPRVTTRSRPRHRRRRAASATSSPRAERKAGS